MKFTQLIELRTSRIDEVRALSEEWAEKAEGIGPHIAEQLCEDRDRSNTYVAIVQFDSWADAEKNNDLPMTQEFAARLTALCDEPPSFRNLDVLMEQP